MRTGSRPMEKFQFAGEGHEYLDGSLKLCRGRRSAVQNAAVFLKMPTISYPSETTSERIPHSQKKI